MADLERRREARRRKILENSQNRFNIITGTEHNSKKTFSYENYSENVTESSLNATHVAEEDIPTEPGETKNKRLKSPQGTYRRTVASALAIFINVLLVALQKFKFDYSSSNINAVFLPLLLYELIISFSVYKQRSETNFIFLLLTATTENKYILAVMRNLELLAFVMEDVMIYFFTYVCCLFVMYTL